MHWLLNSGVSILAATYDETQAQQQETFTQIPWWWWIVIALIVIAIGVIWTLREEEQDATARHPKPATPPEPVRLTTTQPATPAAPTSTPPASPDNLKRINGIGPKIQQILNEHGIYTFEQLAAVDLNFLQRLMEERGWHMANFADWPAQASQLARQKGNQNG